MRAWLLSCWFGSLFFAASSAIAQMPASATQPDMHANCRIPFESLKDPKTGQSFPLSAALNDNANLPENLRRRYIVADLNSADENGYCRGMQEHFTPVGELSEFPRLKAIAAARKTDLATLAKERVDALLSFEETPGDAAGLGVELEDLQNYLQQVHRYKSEPVVKPRVVNGHCIGQTLNLCEIVDGEPRLVHRFVTSSGGWVPPLYTYYAPINVIQSRNWGSDRRYTPLDARRDARMGGGAARIVPYIDPEDGDATEMPNFLHFLPANGYQGERRNGIHEIAGGPDSGGTFGAPVSLGCLRLEKFQSKLVRWWIPTQAKFFIHFEPNRYRAFGHAATGMAKGFQAPRTTEPATATAAARATETAAARTSDSGVRAQPATLASAGEVARRLAATETAMARATETAAVRPSDSGVRAQPAALAISGAVARQPAQPARPSQPARPRSQGGSPYGDFEVPYRGH